MTACAAIAQNATTKLNTYQFRLTPNHSHKDFIGIQKVRSSPRNLRHQVNPVVDYTIVIELRGHDERQINPILSFPVPVSIPSILLPHPTEGTIVTATPFDVGVLLISATDVTGTNAFASG